MSIRRIDLNLFRVFEAIMRSRSVSAAAIELDLTASAVSHALSRLRRALDDELFVPGPAGMEPTLRALELAPDVHDGIQRLSAALAARPFVPSDAVRTFCIATSDYPASTIVPPLLARLAAAAPGVALRLFPGSRLDAVYLLDEGSIDLVLGWIEAIPERMRHRTLVTEHEALVVRKDHPLTRGILTKTRLFDFPYVVVELTGTEDRGIDGFVGERGLVRRTWIERLLIETAGSGGPIGKVAVTVPNYGPVAPILEQTDMIATLPRRLALQVARSGSLVMLDLPYEPLQVRVDAVWHQRADRDRGLRWLVDEMVDIMQPVPGDAGRG